MPGKNKIINAIVSFFIVVLIFYFLGKTLSNNWQKIKEYQFSFNYFYLLISCFFPPLSVISLALIWNSILRVLEPQNEISNFKAFKIFFYSRFGRYIPGKVWMPLGKVYLGHREGVSLKALSLSIILETALFLVSGSLVSLFFLSMSLGSRLLGFYYIIGLVVIVGGLTLVHPKIFYPILNFTMRKLKKKEISLEPSLNYRQIIRITFCYCGVFILNGIGFFLLINSIAFLSWQSIAGIIGIFTIAGITGVAALFAPSGLGVREGMIAGLLQFYFPLGIAVLISLIARIWSIFTELILLILTYFYKRNLPLCEEKK